MYCGSLFLCRRGGTIKGPLKASSWEVVCRDGFAGDEARVRMTRGNGRQAGMTVFMKNAIQTFWHETSSE